MTTRRPPRGRNMAEHLAEIHRQLQRNDRRMARLARSLEQLFQLLRELHGDRLPRALETRPNAAADRPSEL